MLKENSHPGEVIQRIMARNAPNPVEQYLDSMEIEPPKTLNDSLIATLAAHVDEIVEMLKVGTPPNSRLSNKEVLLKVMSTYFDDEMQRFRGDNSGSKTLQIALEKIVRPLLLEATKKSSDAVPTVTDNLMDDLTQSATGIVNLYEKITLALLFKTLSDRDCFKQGRYEVIQKKNRVAAHTEKHLDHFLSCISTHRLDTSKTLDPHNAEEIRRLIYELIATLLPNQPPATFNELCPIALIEQVQTACENRARSRRDIPQISLDDLPTLSKLLVAHAKKLALAHADTATVDNYIFGGVPVGSNFVNGLRDMPLLWGRESRRRLKTEAAAAIIPSEVSDFYIWVKNALEINEVGTLLADKGATPEQKRQGRSYIDAAKIYLEEAQKLAVMIETRLRVKTLHIEGMLETLDEQEMLLSNISSPEVFFGQIEGERAVGGLKA